MLCLFEQSWLILYLTYHWSLKMSRQIAPVTELMLGCQILVMNLTCNTMIHCKVDYLERTLYKLVLSLNLFQKPNHDFFHAVQHKLTNQPLPTKFFSLTIGGLNGYVSGILISKRNLPPSYGVSGGPMISPRRCVYVSFMSSTLMLQA